MKPGYRSVDGYPLHSGRGRTLRDLTCGVVLVLAGASARAATITVNSTADTAANDGVCTLREAIIAANTNTASGAMAGECAAGAAGLDTIAFNIPGAGVQTMTTDHGAAGNHRGGPHQWLHPAGGERQHERAQCRDQCRRAHRTSRCERRRGWRAGHSRERDSHSRVEHPRFRRSDHDQCERRDHRGQLPRHQSGRHGAGMR